MVKAAKFEIQKGKHLNVLLGYKGLCSFSSLYNGGSINAFGRPDASMHTLKHELNGQGKIRFIAVHTTYFQVTDKVIALNAHIEKVGPVSQEEAIRFFDECLEQS